MKKVTLFFVAASLFSMAAPVGAEVTQVWECRPAEGKTMDDAIALSKEWLKLAKEADENASVRILYPLAGSAENGTFLFVFFLPDFTSWGKFEDAYPDSALAAMDSDWGETAPCKLSTLWWAEDL